METTEYEHWRVMKWYEEELFDLGCNASMIKTEIDKLRNTLIDTEKDLKEAEKKIWETSREFIDYLSKKALENEEVAA